MNRRKACERRYRPFPGGSGFLWLTFCFVSAGEAGGRQAGKPAGFWLACPSQSNLILIAVGYAFIWPKINCGGLSCLRGFTGQRLWFWRR